MRPTAREAPESNAARTTTTGPHHESRATGSQTQGGKRSGTVRQECRDAIASPPKGTTALRDGQPTGNKPKGIGDCTHGRTDGIRLANAIRCTGSQGPCSSAPPRRQEGDRSTGSTG